MSTRRRVTRTGVVRALRMMDEVAAGGRPAQKATPQVIDIEPICNAPEMDAARQLIFDTFAQVGAADRFRFAFARSGIVVSRDNVSRWPKEKLDAWNRALREWRRFSPAERSAVMAALERRGPGRAQRVGN